jgi:hypothetical protein
MAEMETSGELEGTETSEESDATTPAPACSANEYLAGGECIRCPTNSTSGAGSVGVASCSCAAGFSWNQDMTECVAGTETETSAVLEDTTPAPTTASGDAPDSTAREVAASTTTPAAATTDATTPVAETATTGFNPRTQPQTPNSM